VSGTGRRLVTLVVAAGAVAAPAVVLRVTCALDSCGPEESVAPVPFCSLPATTRELISAGFYQGRSPDAMGVTSSTAVVTRGGGGRTPWPSLDVDPDDVRVPLAFLGPSFDPGSLEADVTLSQIAPTLEAALGIRRPHPEVRSGQAIAAVVGGDAPAPPLVVEIVWRGVGSTDLAATDASPFFRSLSGRAAKGRASVGSLPLDPVAVLTTIGAGGLPREHGITGATIRGQTGEPVAAWSSVAPPPVIAELGDDLDRVTNGEARIALVGTAPSDRGLIGGRWYPGADDDVVHIVPPRQGDEARRRVDELLRSGWGAGGAPDLLGVVVRDSIHDMDATTRDIVRHVSSEVPDAAFVITATGTQRSRDGAIDAAQLSASVTAALGVEGLIAASAAGGLFVDERAALAAALPTQRIVDAMREYPDPSRPGPLFADAFPAFAVAFGTYC
jgi:hypothetical protein